jgi:uncharacterized protein (DUF697 family)
MTTCRQEALRWVHRYAVGGAAFAAIPLPLSTTAGLTTLETHLATVIADIYGEPATGFATTVAGGALGVMGQGLKFAACQASCFVPVLGIPIRMTIAGATIESLGHAIVAHFERKHPGRPFVAKPQRDTGSTPTA